MPRPRKQKIICDLPRIDTFAPSDGSSDKADIITMSIEEYEVIRLIDYESLNQVQCAAVMNVARSTVQRLYMDARKKLADSVINGKILKISGGDYTLCVKKKNQARCGSCTKYRNRQAKCSKPQ